MSQYIVRRVLLMIPTLIGVSLLVTAMVRLLPGDAVDILVTENAIGGGRAEFNNLIDQEIASRGLDPDEVDFRARQDIEAEIVDAEMERRGLDPETAGSAQRQEARNALGLEAYKDTIRARLGLDKNYIEQWWAWVINALQGDLGESIQGGINVRDEMLRRLPATMQLGAFAMLFGVLIALPVGIVSAVRQDSWPDYSTRSVAIAMIALPSFFLATMVIALGSRWFDYAFPTFYEDLWSGPSANLQLVLPAALILGAQLSGTLMRLTRTQMLEVLRQDYVRTARAKGVRERGVIIGHAVRNAMLPVVTILGLQVPILIGGSLVLEVIFGIPGISRYLFTSINARDFPAVIAVNMVVAVAIVVTNLVVDLTYAYLDPRVKLG